MIANAVVCPLHCELWTADCAPRTVHIHAYLICLICLIYLLLIYPLLIYPLLIYRWLGLAPVGSVHLVRADRAEGRLRAAG